MFPYGESFSPQGVEAGLAETFSERVPPAGKLRTKRVPQAARRTNGWGVLPTELGSSKQQLGFTHQGI